MGVGIAVGAAKARLAEIDRWSRLGDNKFSSGHEPQLIAKRARSNTLEPFVGAEKLGHSARRSGCRDYP